MIPHSKINLIFQDNFNFGDQTSSAIINMQNI